MWDSHLLCDLSFLLTFPSLEALRLVNDDLNYEQPASQATPCDELPDHGSVLTCRNGNPDGNCDQIHATMLIIIHDFGHFGAILVIVL